MTRLVKILLFVLLGMSQAGMPARADDRAVAGALPDLKHEVERDRGFCLSRSAECEGDYMLERDRQDLRDRRRRIIDAARRSTDPAAAPMPVREPAPPLPDSRRYRDFCLGHPGECSGNFVLDRDRFELRDRKPSSFGRRRAGQ